MPGGKCYGLRLVGPIRKDLPKAPKIDQLIDEAMSSIERNNTSLKGVPHKGCARPALDKSPRRSKRTDSRPF